MTAEFVDPEKFIKPIGIVGGRGRLATDNIATILDQEARKNYPPFGLPTLRREFPASLLALTPEGTVADPIRPSQRLLSVVTEVGPACEFFIITAHAPHLAQDEIEKVSGSTLLSIVDITLEEVSRIPNLKRVGVMGYGSTTLARNLYQKRLEDMNIICVTPLDQISNQLDNAIDEVVEKGGPVEGLVPKVELACRDLLYTAGAQAIILACSELPLVLDLLSVDEKIFINPNQLIAEAAVRKAHSLLQERNYPQSK